MNDFNFIPDWYRNLNTIQKAFEPAVILSENLKWMREMTQWQEAMKPAIESSTLLHAADWSTGLRELYQNNIEFFTNINSIKKQLNDELLFTKTFFNFQNTFSESLKAISKNAMFTNDSEFLKNFNNTSARIAELTSEMPEKEIITKDDLEQIRNDVQQLGQTLMEKMHEGFDGKRAQITWHLTIIGFLLTLYSIVIPYIEAAKKQGKPATTEQIEAIRSDVKKLVDSAFENHVRSTFARMATNLYLKPTDKSLCIARITQNEKIHILFTHHKWAQVTILDKDGLPATGWVLKKYLNK